MRLASFNILHGRSLGDGVVSTERLVEACMSLQADVLCLQEVDRNQARSGHVDQTAAVAEAMGAAAWRFEPAVLGEPGGDRRAAGACQADDEPEPTPDEPAYGVGLVSRRPVLGWHAFSMSAPPMRSPVYVPGRKPRFILLRDEPRVALAAELEWPERPDRAGNTGPSGPVLVVTVHLSFVPGWNALQLRRLTPALAALGPDCALLGDLNLPGALPRWASGGWRSLATARTFPADRPTMQIDHALGRGQLPSVTNAVAVRLPVSDHRALVVDLADDDGQASG